MHAASGRLSDQIKSALSVSQAAEHILGMELRRAGREKVGLCPFHDEKTPSFSINDEKGVFLCRGCGVHGDVISLVAKHKGFEDTDSIFWLAEHLGLERFDRNQLGRSTAPNPESERRALRLKQGYALLGLARDAFVGMRSRNAFRDFSDARQLDPAIADQYEVGFAPDLSDNDWSSLVQEHGGTYQGVALPTTIGPLKRLLEDVGLMIFRQGRRHSFFRNRIVFPIHDVQGRVCGFAGRAVSADARPKYLNSPDSDWFSKSQMLYGAYAGSNLAPIALDAWRERRNSGMIYVVEGYMDVLRLAELGCWAVAPMGTATTEHHLVWLTGQDKPLTFIFDGDVAGRKAAEKVVTNLWPHWNDYLAASVASMPEGADPDDWFRVKGRRLEKLPREDYVEAILNLPAWAPQQSSGASFQIRLWHSFKGFLELNATPDASLSKALLQEAMLYRLPAIPRQGNGLLSPCLEGSLSPDLPGITTALRCIRTNPCLSASLPSMGAHADLEWVRNVPGYSALLCLLAAQHYPFDLSRDTDWVGWSVHLNQNAGVPASVMQRWRELQPLSEETFASSLQALEQVGVLIKHLQLGQLWMAP